MMESANEALKLIAMARNVLINCNVDWKNEDVASVIVILDEVVDKLAT